MDKEDEVQRHTHTQREYYSAIKKDELLPFATTWVELECIIISKISHPEKDKYYIISLICRIEGTKQMNIWEGKKRERGKQTRRDS